MCGATLTNLGRKEKSLPHGNYIASKTGLNVRQLAIALLHTESQMG